MSWHKHNKKWETWVYHGGKRESLGYFATETEAKARRAARCLELGLDADADAGAASDFRGVAWDKKSSKWRAKINVDGKDKRLGTFEGTARGEVDAALAFDIAARAAGRPEAANFEPPGAAAAVGSRGARRSLEEAQGREALPLPTASRPFGGSSSALQRRHSGPSAARPFGACSSSGGGAGEAAGAAESAIACRYTGLGCGSRLSNPNAESSHASRCKFRHAHPAPGCAHGARLQQRWQQTLAAAEVEVEEEEEAPPPAPGAVSAPPTDSEPSKWQVGQLVEARAQNSGARAGYEHCHIKAVQPDGRYTVRFTDEAFDQSDIVDVLALGSSLGRLRRGPSVILPPHARLYG